MSIPNNTKIETRALNALENVIDEHTTMEHDFNYMDKEMAWDGYIWIYKGYNVSNKKNFDDKLPVQIKGHVDNEKKYINKQRITYPVDLDDLNIYFHDRGVLYFQIFISGDGKKKEIFYSSLFPSKIKSYLEEAKRRKNRSTINIQFIKLEKKPEKLDIVAKQFSKESRMQGFGSGQIVQNTIMLKDMDKITSFTATAVGVRNEYEFVQRVSSGDVCFYGTKEGSPFKVPLEWQENEEFFICKEVHQKISMGQTFYYEKYKVQTSSNGDTILVLSKNLNINLTKGKFHFEVQTDINDLARDAKFILAMINNSEFKIDGIPFKYQNLKMPKELEAELNFFIELSDTLSMIEFDYNKPFRELLSKTRKELVDIVDLKNGIHNKYFTNQIHIYNWKLENKYIPVIAIRNENDEKNKLINAIYSKENQMFVKNEKDEYFKVPILNNIDVQVLSNLYYYNYNYFYEQIDKADINEFTVNKLNNVALRLVQAYDNNQDKKLLEIALYQLDKLKNIEGKKAYYIINKLQIKKRLKELTDEDIREIKSLDDSDFQILCAINVLLENKEKAKFYYDKLDKETQKFFADYPIYNLYKKLIN
ncbi:hypothetical protein [Clostridium sp.]|uniref:hypothetical protein n=1 Tax=Clostridium sp. TaxID=1506 RepID=UPI002842B67D|nr:hypothetical protein [Clostridium sp.]MDR3598075.1 hypothetical protein [Clostridium sp.]